MKKALIVSPYLNNLGGGERYILSAAAALEKIGYDTTLAWDNLIEIKNLTRMLGIELKNPHLAPDLKKLYFDRRPWAMYRATRLYDVVFYLSDGSLPLLGGKKNILHMQVPFHDVGGRSIANQVKKKTIAAVVVNSTFTKNVVDREYGIDSVVVYPPVDVEKKKSVKDKIILSVGRFEPSLNVKKHDVLIDAFRLCSPKMKGWKLVLAGSSSNDEWIRTLKNRAKGLPIEFVVNATYHELCAIYNSAAIYWHAAGYGVDENKNPELVEHFGITTAEAIGYGCVPLVVPYGGQREIVTATSLHWTTMQELCEKTLSVQKQKDTSAILANLSIDRYNERVFEEGIQNLVA